MYQYVLFFSIKEWKKLETEKYQDTYNEARVI